MLLQKNITIGIIGYELIEQALDKWLAQYTECKTIISDPPRGICNDLGTCDVFFISIHISTHENESQDLTKLEGIIQTLPDAPIFIRTTLIPGSSDNLTQKFQRPIYFMPEFLTERTAFPDFCSQDIIVTGERELMDAIFKDKRKIYMSNMEAELAKYAHNVFGALKVTYFNEIYEICIKNKMDYANVLNAILMSGYINSEHTKVPGPDGLRGYGGKCFPKDVHAFQAFNKDNDLGELLKLVISINSKFRK